MEWDVKLYRNNHAFVAQYGRALLEYLPEGENAAVLDMGCGDGTLTAELAGKYRRVVGIDQSERMISAAKENHPGIEFRVMDALDMPFENEFGAVFSNAVFHWIEDQPRLLAQIYKALKPGGRLVCEFGAHGNIGRIWTAFCAAMASHSLRVATRFFYPANDEYSALLVNAGFSIMSVCDFDRPTPLSGGEEGLRGWLTQFLAADISVVDEAAREDVFTQTERALRGSLWDGERWFADYRRIRAVAEKPATEL